MKGKAKKTITERKVFTTVTIFLLISLILIRGPIFFTPLIKTANAIDIISYTDSNTTLSITVIKPEAKINWYDLRDSKNTSKLNTQIDVNEEYKFCINISCNQGWDDIEYINITAWYDNGDDNNTYNQTSGGNLKMFLQYMNNSDTNNTAFWRMLWPNDEVTFNKSKCKEKSSNYSGGLIGSNTKCHELTFVFTPGYQFRYAPGINNKTAGFNDPFSWNFNITITSASCEIAYATNEFGVYSYSELATEGMPSLYGYPGYNATGDNVTVVIRSNIKYALSVDVDDFVHETHPTANLSKQNLWIRGGDKTTSTNFTENEPIYLYKQWCNAEKNGKNLTTDDIEYKCYIPVAQTPGNYTANLYYYLESELG